MGDLVLTAFDVLVEFLSIFNLDLHRAAFVAILLFRQFPSEYEFEDFGQPLVSCADGGVIRVLRQQFFVCFVLCFLPFLVVFLALSLKMFGVLLVPGNSFCEAENLCLKFSGDLTQLGLLWARRVLVLVLLSICSFGLVSRILRISCLIAGMRFQIHVTSTKSCLIVLQCTNLVLQLKLKLIFSLSEILYLQLKDPAFFHQLHFLLVLLDLEVVEFEGSGLLNVQNILLGLLRPLFEVGTICKNSLDLDDQFLEKVTF